MLQVFGFGQRIGPGRLNACRHGTAPISGDRAGRGNQVLFDSPFEIRREPRGNTGRGHRPGKQPGLVKKRGGEAVNVILETAGGAGKAGGLGCLDTRAQLVCTGHRCGGEGDHILHRQIKKLRRRKGQRAMTRRRGMQRERIDVHNHTNAVARRFDRPQLVKRLTRQDRDMGRLSGGVRQIVQGSIHTRAARHGDLAGLGKLQKLGAKPVILRHWVLLNKARALKALQMAIRG
mmetsp:Transcript_7076/g.11497  ORF Transcript_7076/g.11497 Transcript_7076/m.11497 type:complete len:233 (+) Transcript_7076:1300-1998(+)